MGLIFAILFMVIGIGSAAALALVHNARDADEEWEEAIEKEQNKRKK